MAAREEKTQELVLPPSEDIRFGDGNPRPRTQLRKSARRITVRLARPRPSESIAVGVPRDGEEPGLGRFRRARLIPRSERAEDRVVERVLRVGERTGHADQLPEDPWVDASDLLRVRGLVHARRRQSTGRTSIAWKGSVQICLARPRA